MPVALNGTAFLAYDAEVTPGIYKEFELSIDKLEIGNPAIADIPPQCRVHAVFGRVEQLIDRIRTDQIVGRGRRG